MEDEMKYREFTVRGRVYSGNRSHATHTIYWALAEQRRRSGYDVLIDDIVIQNGEEDDSIQKNRGGIVT